MLISNKYAPKLKLFNNIYKDNTNYFRIIYLNEVRVYKDVLYKDYYL